MLPRRKRTLLIIGFMVILSAGALYASEKLDITNFFEKESSTVFSDESFINLDPPTKEEKQAGDRQKEKNETAEDRRNHSDGQKKQTANVIITDAGQYDDIVEVRAFIPDHYQDGTCTITFTKDALRVEKSTPAYRDASTTVCTNPLFSRSDFNVTGDWQVMVTYDSVDAQGISQQQSVNIR